MNAPEKKKKVMPKGGRKGGSSFPRVSLSDALGYSKKLVTKTHVARIPIDVVYSGVVGAKGSRGGTRASALKQYGLIVGDTKQNYSASSLAKEIAAAPQEELIVLYRDSALRPNIFKKLSETFHGDSVSRAKLKQRAAELKVHPDETETCVDIYLSSMQTAQLIQSDGELFNHIVPADGDTLKPDVTESSEVGQDDVEDEADAKFLGDNGSDSEDPDQRRDGGSPSEQRVRRGATPRAMFTVSVQLDASLDTDKLEKQLALLKKYGAL